MSWDGVHVLKQVSRLVCAAFHGPCPEGMECCHNDGNKLNNAAWNLRWDTHRANIVDRTNHGSLPIGEKHHQAKLTERDVINMRAMHANGASIVSIAKEFGVAVPTAGDVVRRKNWRHIPGAVTVQEIYCTEGKP